MDGEEEYPSHQLLAESKWNFLFAFLAFPALLQLCVLPFLPESPRYLLMERKDEAAAEQGPLCVVVLRASPYGARLAVYNAGAVLPGIQT
ncbi:hypothetical protein CRUP_015421 [Coryphaenoides rupestris]|nr:hypothetical protein CRUP_015421 [Coryphaenoides rupestris]